MNAANEIDIESYIIFNLAQRFPSILAGGKIDRRHIKIPDESLHWFLHFQLLMIFDQLKRNSK